LSEGPARRRPRRPSACRAQLRPGHGLVLAVACAARRSIPLVPCGIQPKEGVVEKSGALFLCPPSWRLLTRPAATIAVYGRSPLADAARLLGEPERTIRRWAAQGKLPATRTATDGSLRSASTLTATWPPLTASMATRMATRPLHPRPLAATYLQELQARTEAAAFWQGRASVLEQRVQQLEVQAALPAPAAPTTPELAPQRTPDSAALESTQQPPETMKRAPWWMPWRRVST
jgi:hypothetical protein